MRLALSIADARNDLPALSKRVRDEGPVVITHHGRPESVLVSHDACRRLDRVPVGVPGRRAVVLAASGAKRLGARKLAAGVMRLVSLLAKARVPETIVVSDLSFPSPFRDLPDGVTLLPTSNSNSGFASSLKKGLRYVEGDCDTVLVAFASRPRILPATVESLFSAFEERRRKPLLVVPVHDGRRGHPVLLSARLIPEALRMDPRWGLAALVRRHARSVAEVEVEDPGILRRA